MILAGWIRPYLWNAAKTRTTSRRGVACDRNPYQQFAIRNFNLLMPCQPGNDNVFCQTLDESEWDGPVRRKRAITPLLSAGVEPQPPADRQQLITGSSTLHLPFDPSDVHHSVHKRAIVTVATIVASIVSAIQPSGVWIHGRGSRVPTTVPPIPA